MASIEWIFEELDGDEIVNVQHGDTYKQTSSYSDPGMDFRIGLVRDSIKDRSWAYVEGGSLPSHFTDAYGEETVSVPEKYHREVL